jgi:hypothetical protein
MRFAPHATIGSSGFKSDSLPSIQYMTHGVLKRLGTRAILASMVAQEAVRAQGLVAGLLRLLGPAASMENSQNRDGRRPALHYARRKIRELQGGGVYTHRGD